MRVDPTTLGIELPNSDVERLLYGGGAVLFIGLAVVPLVTTGNSILRLLFTAFIWSGYAVAWNLFSGYSGYTSFGHSVFFGTGASTSTILLAQFDISPWIGMLVGALLAAVVAVLVGYITLDYVGGIYFSLLMLSIPLAAIPIFLYFGYIEVSIPFNPERFGYMSYRNLERYYYISLSFFILSVVCAWKVRSGRVGLYLRAIKTNEKAARSLGINTFKWKLSTFALSGFLSGIFGTIYIQTQFIYTPQSVFGINVLAQPVVIAIVGGVESVMGPAVAGLILFPIASTLQSSLSGQLPGIDNFLYGLLLILVIIFLPEGFYVEFKDHVKRWFRNR